MPLLLALLLLLSGCWLTPQKPAPVPTVSVQTGPATDNQIQNLQDQLSLQKGLAQRAAGAVYGAQDANLGNPEGLPKEAVKVQLEEAESALPPPTPEQRLAKEQENTRILAGQLQQVRSELGLKVDENRKLREQLDQAANREQELRRAGEKERFEAAAKLQAQFDRFSRQIEDERASSEKKLQAARDEMLKKQALYLNIAGAGCIVLFGLGAGFGGLLGAKTTAPFLVISAVCFGLAQIVSEWWFKWAILGSVGLVLGISAWWAYRKHQQGILHEAAEQKAKKFNEVVSALVPVLDDAYDHAEGEAKKFLEEKIFSRLSSAFDRSQKATVHEVRAANLPKPSE